jgi:hypothetical protein
MIDPISRRLRPTETEGEHMASKISQWKHPAGRKLRVVFVDDSFWGYADLPAKPNAQKALEDGLRRSTRGTVSLYRPGSRYRDAVTLPLTAANLQVFRAK